MTDSILGFLGWLVRRGLLAISTARWRLARDTGVHRYYEHADGRRKVVKVGLGHQAINRRWLDGGTWQTQLQLGSGSPHRKPINMPEPRFSLIVDNVLLEADSFGGIIKLMRERGHSDDTVLAASFAARRKPRGAELRSSDSSNLLNRESRKRDQCWGLP